MLFIYGLLDSSSPNHYSPLCFSPHLAPTRSVTMSPRRGYLGLATMLFTASLVCSGCRDKVHLTTGGPREDGILVDGTKGGSALKDDRFTGAVGSNIGIGDFTNSPGE